MKGLQIQKAGRCWIYDIERYEMEYFSEEFAFDYQMIEDDIDHGRTFIASYDTTRIVAYFTIEKTKDVLYIANIVIIKEHRGKGFSKYILDFISFLAKFNKIKIIGLHVSMNNSVAKHAYLKYGFIHVKERIKSFYPNEDMVYIEKKV